MGGRAAIRIAAALVCAAVAGTGRAEGRRLTSPDGTVAVEVGIDAQGRLSYEVAYRGARVVAPSPIGLSLDGTELGVAASLAAVNVREVRERFPVRGAHAEAAYDAVVALLTVTPRRGEPYGVQLSVANGGFAWRFLIPGGGRRRVTGEAACWRLPPESRVWFAGPRSDGTRERKAGAMLRDGCEFSAQGPAPTMPLVVELPAGQGYVVVTEAALYRYSGLRLEICREGEIQGTLAEREGFEVEGRFRTPWRVLLLAPTLDALANSDLVAALNPPPDPSLFGPEEWTAGGRCARIGGRDDPDGMTAAGEKRAIDCARRLGFEYVLLEEGWETRTNAWDALQAACAYGASNSVRVIVRKRVGVLNQPAGDYAAMRWFLDQVKDAGAAGVKADLAAGEDAGQTTFVEWLLQEAAERKLLVSACGPRKPSGASRTYPNDVSCEAALAFAHCAAGPADYGPLAFSRSGDTTWACQLALAYLAASTLLVMDEQPRRLLDDPKLADAVPFVRSLPTAWDETRVLDGSRLGEVMAVARRKGNVWYVALVNGTPNMKLVSYAPRFTGWRRVRIEQIADAGGDAEGLTASERRAAGEEALIVALEPCGGYVARLTRETP